MTTFRLNRFWAMTAKPRQRSEALTRSEAVTIGKRHAEKEIRTTPSVAPLEAATQGVCLMPYKDRADKAARDAAYNAANKDKRAAWRAANKEHVKAYRSAYNETRRDKAKDLERVRAWRLRNPDYKKKFYRSEHFKQWAAAYHAIPRVALSRRLSRHVRWSLQYAGGKQARWEALVGYSVADLRLHIERQFLRGMGWHNMPKWHVDHIVPLSSFTFESANDPEFKAAWALTNLRPCWASENRRKHAKREFLV